VEYVAYMEDLKNTTKTVWETYKELFQHIMKMEVGYERVNGLNWLRI
jgi:hypothetical protein